MDLDQARDFVRSNHRAVLTTLRDDGSPQMSPVLVAVDDRGQLMVSTRETAAKVNNLRKRPTAWLCVLSDAFFGPWIQVEADVSIVSLPEAMDALVDYYRRTSGEHPDWDDYRQAMFRERRVVLQLTLHRAGPDFAG